MSDFQIFVHVECLRQEPNIFIQTFIAIYRLEFCEKEGLYKKHSVLHISDSITTTVAHILFSVLLNGRP